jgi:hypothetical protein
VTYPGTSTYGPSSDTLTVTVKAASTLSGRLSASTWDRAAEPWITGSLTVSPSSPATGKIQLLADGQVVKSALLSAGMNNRFIMKVPQLSRGAHTIQLRYRGSTTVMPASTGIAQVRVI